MSTISAVLEAPDDLSPVPDDVHYELIEGQLLERNMGSWAGVVESKLFILLYTFAQLHQLGRALTSAVPFRFPDRRILKPDVSFIRAERLPLEQIPRGPMPVVPDLAVEVVSPTDIQYDVDSKVAKYLEAGVKLVWVINPETRVVIIYRVDGSIAGAREGGDLDGEDAVPGFRCRVADLFIP